MSVPCQETDISSFRMKSLRGQAAATLLLVLLFLVSPNPNFIKHFWDLRNCRGNNLYELVILFCRNIDVPLIVSTCFVELSL